jgi:hypothetical protein
MAKRFNNLDAALKYLRPASAGEDGVIPDAPANTPLKKYQDWKAGKVDIDYARAASSNPGRIVKVSIKPFALPSADTNEYVVSMSNRAQGSYGLFGLSAAALGIEDVDNNDVRARGFKPAKANCNNRTGTTATTKTSKLTGIAYKTKPDAGYTFPFGRISTQPSYSDQKAALLALVIAEGETKSVSFQPERF